MFPCRRARKNGQRRKWDDLDARYVVFYVEEKYNSRHYHNIMIYIPIRAGVVGKVTGWN